MTVLLPAEGDWQAVIEAINSPGELLLVCHLNPDGDALGSALALGLALRARGRAVSVSFSEPLRLPDTLRHLPGQDLLVSAEHAPSAPDVMVTFDTGSADRLGDLADRVKTAKQVIVIDHHASNTGYGTTHLVVPTAAATAVVVAELLDRLDAEIDYDVATCLYTGLSTDTGSFRYASTTPEVHRLAARLLDTGIRHDLIARVLYDTHPFAWVSLLGVILTRAVLEPDAAGGLGVIWTYATLDDLAERSLEIEQVEGVIDVIRTAHEAEVAAVCKELPDGGWAVSVRSKGRLNVGEVCVELGGGGHALAAGFTADGSVEDIVKLLRTALDSAPQVDGD